MHGILIAIALAGSIFSTFSTVQAGDIGPELQTDLHASLPTDEIAVIILFKDKANIGIFKKDKARKHRRAAIIRALREAEHRKRQAILPFLQKGKPKRMRPLWIINGTAVTVRAETVGELAAHPGVDRVILDRKIRSTALPAACIESPAGWNIEAIRAQELWNLNYNGASVVVATMDHGVDPFHPDIGPRWRGGSNSWFDPYNERDAPHDNPSGHGTQVMGLLVGGDAGGVPIGIAPGAKWIAAKIFNNAGEASLSGIHLSFQWMLDPDNNPGTDDAPDIVNSSWELVGSENQCVLDFQEDIDILRAAEIAVVFAAGNSGPNPNTSVSPANNSQSLAVGSVGETSGIFSVSDTSSRGPSACDGDIYPQIMAPGFMVVTTDLTFDGLFLDAYRCVEGTSFAAPHVAGAMALLLGAMRDQGITVTVSQLESALKESAVDLDEPGPDNNSGFGLLDVKAAFDWLATNGGPPPPNMSPILHLLLGQ